MIPMLFLLILIFHRIQGKFLYNSESSSIIVVRHIRIPTDHEYYRIRCPYNLNHITLALLNYSNGNCFDLYTKSLHHHICINNQSPCRFHAKSLQLHCNDRSHSNHVDITYHCSILSLQSSNVTTSNNDNISSSSKIDDESIYSASHPSNKITLHALSFPSASIDSEDSIGIFLISLITVFILWLTVCCMWVMRCGHKRQRKQDDDGKCELLSFGPYPKVDNNIDFTIITETKPMIVGNLSGHTSTGGLDNICVYVNPLENKPISSLKITQID